MSRGELRILAPLCLLTGAFGTAQTALIPALPSIQDEFGASAVAATALVSVFAVTGAVSAGILGRLGDMFGKRQIMCIQILIAIGGLLLCAVATGMPMLIGGRAMAGLAAGLFPLAFSVARDELPSARVPSAVAIIAGVGAGGGALGQAVGGVVTDRLGWRAIFWGGVILFAIALVGVRLFIRESPIKTGGRVDVGGATLLALGIAGPMVAISNAVAWGWTSPRTLLLFLLGAVILCVFIAYERRVREPLLHLPTQMLRPVWITNVVSLFAGAGIYGAVALFSQFLQAPKDTGYGFGLDATQAGLVLAPGAALMLICAPFVGRMMTRAGAKPSIMVGCAVSCAGFIGLAAAHNRLALVAFWIICCMAGLATTYSGLPLIILQSVPADQRGQSTGVNIIVRAIGTGLGLQLAATFVVGSAVGGVPTESGYIQAWHIEAVFAGLAALIALMLPNPRPEPAEIVPAIAEAASTP